MHIYIYKLYIYIYILYIILWLSIDFSSFTHGQGPNFFGTYFLGLPMFPESPSQVGASNNAASWRHEVYDMGVSENGL